MSELEKESDDHSRARHARSARRMAMELAISAVFLAAFYAARETAGEGGRATPAAIALAAASIGALVVWLVIYARWHLTHDEFERLIELRAVALAAGTMIVALTGYGLVEFLFDAPSLPVVFAAPVFSIAYGIVRLLMARAYR